MEVEKQIELVTQAIKEIKNNLDNVNVRYDDVQASISHLEALRQVIELQVTNAQEIIDKGDISSLLNNVDSVKNEIKELTNQFKSTKINFDAVAKENKGFDVRTHAEGVISHKLDFFLDEKASLINNAIENLTRQLKEADLIVKQKHQYEQNIKDIRAYNQEAKKSIEEITSLKQKLSNATKIKDVAMVASGLILISTLLINGASSLLAFNLGTIDVKERLELNGMSFEKEHFELEDGTKCFNYINDYYETGVQNGLVYGLNEENELMEIIGKCD